jgi:hypothetical protein
MTKKKTKPEAEAAPAPPVPPDVKEQIHAKHVFTSEELLDLSRQLGRTCNEVSTLEQEKSAVTKDFGGRILSKEILRDSLVDKVTSGYEMRLTDCVVVMDPPNRSKDYFRVTPEGERGEFAERREMTHADFQLTLIEPEPATATETTETEKED